MHITAGGIQIQKRNCILSINKKLNQLRCMKKFKKIFSRLLITLLVLIIAFVGYIKIALPNVGQRRI